MEFDFFSILIGNQTVLFDVSCYGFASSTSETGSRFAAVQFIQWKQRRFDSKKLFFDFRVLIYQLLDLTLFRSVQCS